MSRRDFTINRNLTNLDGFYAPIEAACGGGAECTRREVNRRVRVRMRVLLWPQAFWIRPSTLIVCVSENATLTNLRWGRALNHLCNTTVTDEETTQDAAANRRSTHTYNDTRAYNTSLIARVFRDDVVLWNRHCADGGEGWGERAY